MGGLNDVDDDNDTGVVASKGDVVGTVWVFDGEIVVANGDVAASDDVVVTNGVFVDDWIGGVLSANGGEMSDTLTAAVKLSGQLFFSHLILRFLSPTRTLFELAMESSYFWMLN